MKKDMWHNHASNACQREEGWKGQRYNTTSAAQYPRPITLSFVGDALLAGLSLEPRPGMRGAGPSVSSAALPWGKGSQRGG